MALGARGISLGAHWARTPAVGCGIGVGGVGEARLQAVGDDADHGGRRGVDGRSIYYVLPASQPVSQFSEEGEREGWDGRLITFAVRNTAAPQTAGVARSVPKQSTVYYVQPPAAAIRSATAPRALDPAESAWFVRSAGGFEQMDRFLGFCDTSGTWASVLEPGMGATRNVIQQGRGDTSRGGRHT